MAKTTSKPSRRYSKRKQRHKRDNDHCQYWDMKTGGCDSDGVTSLKYTMSGEKYSWWFCQKHYAKKRRLIYGTCSHSWTENGGQRHCTALRATNTRGPGRKLKGYCRRHERSALEDIGDVRTVEALDRMAEMIEVNADTGCWNLDPYGGAQRPMRTIGGRKWYTYRLSFVWFWGGHANGLELSHDCANSLCCNPMHVTPIRPRQNRDAEHDVTAAVFWAVTSTIKRPPPELQAWADAHSLPLYGTETTRIVDSFMPSEDELIARYWADLAEDEAEDMTAIAV